MHWIHSRYPGAALDAFVRLAAPVDWNADGRQDLLLPIETPGGVPAWRILQATGAIGQGMFALVDPGLPMEAQVVLDEEATVADPRGPRVTDVDGDGIQDVLLLVNGHVQVFKNTLHEEDLLATVTDGMNAHDPGDLRFLPNIQIATAIWSISPPPPRTSPERRRRRRAPTCRWITPPRMSVPTPCAAWSAPGGW